MSSIVFEGQVELRETKLWVQGKGLEWGSDINSKKCPVDMKFACKLDGLGYNQGWRDSLVGDMLAVNAQISIFGIEIALPSN